MEVTMKEARECLLYLQIGKALPLRLIPCIENRTTAVIKVSPLEPSGLKWRTCVDMTASGVDCAVRGLSFGLPTVEDIIAMLGRNHYIVKQDITYMFFNFKIHPSKWVLFGFQHPITGQSYIYPVLPFCFSLSPLIACASSQLVADMIEKEARLRAEGLEGVEPLRSTHG
eukprot:2067647-Rhodomonas_salina.1